MIFGQVETVEAFVALIAKLSRMRRGGVSYRGHRNVSWLPIPALFRQPKALLPFEREASRDLISIHPQEFQPDVSAFDRLVRMQHYGLPTRLLDVSHNPLVALYFASERATERGSQADGAVMVLTVPEARSKYFDSDTVSCLANLHSLSALEKEAIEATSMSIDDDRFNEVLEVRKLAQFVRGEKPYFLPNIKRKDLFRTLYVRPKMSNRRIIAQSGAFLLYGLGPVKVFPRDQGPVDSIAGDMIAVPAIAKHRIRAELDALGINESSLFPEIDRAANYIVRRYKS